MKLSFVLIIIVVFSMSCASVKRSIKRLDKTDICMIALYLGFSALDRDQTINALNDQDFEEGNPVVGNDKSRANFIGIAFPLAVTGLSISIDDEKWRKIILSFGIGSKLTAVTYNNAVNKSH